MAPSGWYLTQTYPIAAHRVVALGARIEALEPARVPRSLAMIENHLLIQIAQIVEHQARAFMKNSRTRASVSASASISACVV